MQRIIYEQIATSLDAMRRCKVDCKLAGHEHLADWIGRHEQRALYLTENYLPSGSGFDCGTKLLIDQCKDDKLVFQCDFHHMDENGYYDGWSEHTVTVRPSLVFGITIKVGGRDRNQIKDYIHEQFDYLLRQGFDDAVLANI